MAAGHAIRLLYITSLLMITFGELLREAEASVRDSESKLLDYLVQRHDKRVKPLGTSNATLQVVMDVGLVQISEVDEKNQILDGLYYIYQKWTDEQLVWNAADYDGITTLKLPEDMIWMPTVGLDNDVDLVRTKTSSTSTLRQVSSDGTVVINFHVNYRSSCPMRMIHFPFDKHNCSLRFLAMMYDGSQLNLTFRDKFSSYFYEENSEFKLIDVTALRIVDHESYEGGPLIIVNYNIAFQRRHLFYLLNLLLPCSLISLVAMFSFCIPPESGERIGLSVTVLLSLSVFLLIVVDSMPSSSEFPLIGTYYFGVILIVTISTGASVCTLRLHYNAQYQVKEVPRWLQRLLFGTLARLLCVTSMYNEEASREQSFACGRSERKSMIKPGKLARVGVGNSFEEQVVVEESSYEVKEDKENVKGDDDNISEIVQFIRDYKNSKLQEETKEKITTQWKYLSLIIDRIFLVIFVCSNCVFTLWIISSAANGSQ